MSQPGSRLPQQWITRSAMLYQWLLLLYPSAFRRAYQAQLAQTFRDQCRQAVQEHGLTGLCRCWLSMLTDLASNALAERLTEGFTMSLTTFIRLAGGLTLLSVVVLFPILFSTGTPLFTAGPVVFHYPSGNVSVAYALPGAPFPLTAKLLVDCCFVLGLLGVVLTQQSWLGRLSGSLALLGQIGLILFTSLERWSTMMPDTLNQLLLRAFYPQSLQLSTQQQQLSAALTPLRLWSVLPFVAGLALSLGLIGCGFATFETGRGAAWRVALLVLGFWLMVGNLGLWWLQWTNPLLYLEAATSLVWSTFFPFFSLYALVSYLLWGWLGFTLWWQKPPREAQVQAALG